METKNNFHEYDYKSGNPAVYVGTYHKYNCGSIAGEWVDLTTFDDYDEFMDYCHEIHNDEEDPEFMYQDFENFPRDWYSECCMGEEMFDRIVEYGNMSEDEREIYDAYTSLHGSDVTFEKTMECYEGKYDSEEDFAERLVDECYPDITDFAKRYFDYESFARDLFCSDYDYCDGYVFRVY